MALTCKYASQNGDVIYANVPIQNARKLECFSQSEPAAPDKKQRTRKTSDTSPTPTDFPRVDTSTQQQRDSTRRRILTDELTAERAALQQAQSVGKAADITLHGKNIQMLEKEISGIK